MPLHCPFEPLRISDVALQDDKLERDLADWLVAFITHGDAGLFDHTNVAALVLAVNEVHGEDTARLVSGFRGENIALVRPEGPEALALAAYYAADMLNGQHLNVVLYRQAMDQRCAEIWFEMIEADRIDLLRNLGCDLGLMLSDTVPACIRPSLDEAFE